MPVVYSKHKLLLHRVLIYGMIAIMMFDGSHMWQTSGILPISHYYSYLGVMVFAFIDVFVLGKFMLNRNVGISALMITAYLAIYGLVRRYNIETYFPFFLLFLVVMFVYMSIIIRAGLFRDFCKSFVNVMVVLGVVTTTFWLLGSVLGIMPGRRGVYYHWADATRSSYSYFNLYFENPVQNMDFMGVHVVRNCGLFAESPGMSSWYIVATAVALYLNNLSWKNWKVLLCVITAASTFSTKAFITIPFLFLFVYWLKMDKKVTRKLIWQSLAFIFLMIVIAILAFTILDDKSSSGSFILRMDDLTAAFKTWLQNPLFGCGFNNTDSILRNVLIQRLTGGFSMGWTVLLAQGGLYLTVFYVFAFFIAYTRSKNTYYRRCILIIAACMFIDMLISNIIYSAKTLFIIATAYASLSARFSVSSQRRSTELLEFRRL